MKPIGGLYSNLDASSNPVVAGLQPRSSSYTSAAYSSDRSRSKQPQSKELARSSPGTPKTKFHWDASSSSSPMATLVSKIQNIVEEHSGLITFEPSFNEGKGSFYIPKEKLSVSVVWEYIAFGFTDEEISKLLDLESPAVVSAIRSFIHGLL